MITEKEVEALAVSKVSNSKTRLETINGSKQKEVAVTTKETRTSDVEAGVETGLIDIALRATHHTDRIVDDQEAQGETDMGKK